jgi:hypothetical protein
VHRQPNPNNLAEGQGKNLEKEKNHEFHYFFIIVVVTESGFPQINRVFDE